MTDFDLRTHIRTVLAETTSESLDDLTALIFSRTPKAEIREAYRQALAEIVRKELAYAPRAPKNAESVIFHSSDHTGLTDSGDEHAEEAIQHVSTVTVQRPTAEQPHPVQVAPRVNVGNSRIALFRRNHYRMSVWVGDKTYRHILDCTQEDLIFAAAESDRQSVANAVTARRYRRLLKAMEHAAAAKVADLSDAQIEEALSDD